MRALTIRHILVGATHLGRINMTSYRYFLLLFSLLLVSSARAQGVRGLTRPSKGTIVSQSQAVDLTLTLGQASVRPIQAWVRTAGAIDKSGKILTAYLDPRDAQLVKVGQRVRVFTPESKSSMFQAWVTRVLPEAQRTKVEVTLAAIGWKNSTNYVMEIVAERGQFLSVPNEAIIEEGSKHIVYVQKHSGQYVPQEIDTGVQGELYTQVLHGLNEGEQVVTFGSFFIDSEYKLKGTDEAPTTDEHHH